MPTLVNAVKTFRYAAARPYFKCQLYTGIYWYIAVIYQFLP